MILADLVSTPTSSAAQTDRFETSPAAPTFHVVDVRHVMQGPTAFTAIFTDVVMDFTNPIIRGMSVFHCHLLNHEDKGMMAKILFE
jgi:FtsP/CotA-like multicopper oxidase with cupredoxin domain